MEKEESRISLFLTKHKTNIKRIIYIIFFIIFLLCANLAVNLYYGYKESSTPSPYMLAVEQMGFTDINIKEIKKNKLQERFISSQDKQDAILKIFQMAGYFKPKKFMHDLMMLKIKNPQKIYKQIMPAIIESKADGEPENFDVQYLRKNLFKGSSLTIPEIQDWIVYLAQSGCKMKSDQVYTEIERSSWMAKYIKEFRAAAEELGIFDKRVPNKNYYDFAIIKATSRPKTLARLLDYVELLKSGIFVKHGLVFLTSNRPIWAEFDGIQPDMLNYINYSIKENKPITMPENLLSDHDEDKILKEGIEYISHLSNEFNIRLNGFGEIVTFHEYTPDIPSGYKLNRHYPNYSRKEKRRLSEHLMAKDLLETYTPGLARKSSRYNGAVSDGQSLNFTHAIQLYAKKFFKDVKSGKYPAQKYFTILIQSNNPSIDRKRVVAIDAFEKEKKLHNLDDISFDIEVVGFMNRDDIAYVSSEFAKLVYQKYKVTNSGSGIDKSLLLMSERDNEEYYYIFGDPPLITDNDMKITGSKYKKFFD